MVYKLHFNIDGGCRNNGRPNAIGVAAVIQWRKTPKSWRGDGTHPKPLKYTQILQPDGYIAPTSQRAELTALIMALEIALEKWGELDSQPLMMVKIRMDSEYALKCIGEWLSKWESNGFINSRGQPVTNQDLIKQARNLAITVRTLGDLKCEHVPREENTCADQACRDALEEYYS